MQAEVNQGSNEKAKLYRRTSKRWWLKEEKKCRQKRMLRKIFAAFRLLSAKQIKGAKKEQGK
jgi:hypothetical protein